MKKIVLLLAASLICLTTISAQVTQEAADQIVIDRLSDETGDFTVYAKECVQTAFEVTTATGEILELGYPCWVYYVNFARATNGKYLIVKENSGNLMEINTKNDVGPNDLTEWIIMGSYPIEIPFTEYSLEGTSCKWRNLNYDEKVIIINSAEELEHYISCTDYPDIDFSQYSLLLASGKTDHAIFNITAKELLQLSCGEYELLLEILLYETEAMGEWTVAIMMKKTKEESTVELHIAYEGGHYPTITPDKTWHIEYGMWCPGGWCYLGLETITTGGIRIFNGKEYYELLTDYPRTEVVTYVREKEGKVFFYAEDCDKEHLMYNYNLDVGDEVFIMDPRHPFSVLDLDSRS